MNSELLIEHLGFAPIHFIDKVINLVNQALYNSLGDFEETVRRELGEHETERCMQQIETLFERSIDGKFDRFELYVLKNILCFPPDKNILLPHYRGLKLDVTAEDEKLLDDEITVLNTKILQQRKMRDMITSKRALANLKLKELQIIGDKLSKFESIAKESGCFPLSDLHEKMKVLKKVEEIIHRIQQKTAGVDWQKVPMIGKLNTSTNLEKIQPKVLDCLLKSSASETEVSSWEITHDYREAVKVGTAADINAVRGLFV